MGGCDERTSGWDGCVDVLDRRDGCVGWMD